MKRGYFWTSCGIAGAMLAQAATAAPIEGMATEKAALTQCIEMRTTGADRVLTAQWIFAAMAKSPHIASLSSVPDQRKVEVDQAFSQLLTRIVMKDCLDQMLPLATQDLEGAFELGGRALGEVAMQELMGNEKVDKAIADYTRFLSEEDFRPLIEAVEKRQSK